VTDRHGAIVQETAYFPFGGVRHSHGSAVPSRQPYGFTGKEQDSESDLHYFEARYLAGTLARFVTPDPKFANPAMLSSNELASYLSKPQKANAYAYVLNNPLIYTDPTGLDEETEVARSVVEGLKQVHAKTGAFAEVIRADATPTHWLFVDDQSTVTLDQLEKNQIKAQTWRIPESALSRREITVLPSRATVEKEIPGYFTRNEDESLAQSERSAMDLKYFELLERTQNEARKPKLERISIDSQEDTFLPLMK
jgi:RHS repeat-associated protein